jgi:hypothetical protein
MSGLPCLVFAMPDDRIDLQRPQPAGLQSDAKERTVRAVRPARAVAIVFALIGGLGACVLTDPSLSPSPVPRTPATTSSVALASPTTAAAPTSAAIPTIRPDPPPPVLRAGDYAVVNVGELAMRDAPDGMPFAFTQFSTEVYVVEEREGWYLVEAREPYAVEYLFGWVPATLQVSAGVSDETIATLLWTRPADCTVGGEFDTLMVGFRHPQSQLDCYGGLEEIRLEGYAVDIAPADPAYAGEPSWLANDPVIALSSVIGPAAEGGQVAIHVPPDLEVPIPMSDRDANEGIRLAIIGHYDDPASSACRRAPLDDHYPPMDAAFSELWCRQRFVVDSVDVIDPG